MMEKRGFEEVAGMFNGFGGELSGSFGGELSGEFDLGMQPPQKMARKGGSAREGDWTCPACGNNNFADRMVCNMRKCGAPRPGGDGGGMFPPMMCPPVMASPKGGGKGKGGQDWTCNVCGNVNFADRMVCNMRKCGAPRGTTDPGQMGMGQNFMGYGSFPSAPAMKGSPGCGKGGGKGAGRGGADWSCGACGNLNFADRAFCNLRKCNAPRPLTDWICTQCGNSNFADRAFCNMRKCQAPRPDMDPKVVTELVSKGFGKGSKK